MFEQLRTELQRLELVCVVLEVNSRCRLLQKIGTFHSDLCVTRRFGIIYIGIRAYVLQLINAVALVRLVVLDQDYLLEAHGFLLGVGYELLIKAFDVAVRDFYGSESQSSQDVITCEIFAVLIFIV